MTLTATAAVRAVRSLLLPITDHLLLLPNAAVAEIIPYEEPDPVAKAPDWMLGMLLWRDRKIPMISFEAICGAPRPVPGPRARLAVINVLEGSQDPPFYALAIQDLPHLVQVEPDGVRVVEVPKTTHPAVRQMVEVYGEFAQIPSLETLEAMVRNVFF
ncbi:MAG: hypothetical protein B7Z66_10425 [Chromatiales bacterium 21-64-14]|nr:MAG: hypothetical protein B7Z66_10425 [Chromatiales bacterium 21-64-14]HQU15786.1 chemotaxis protein CheW [Gammaproteobacteria bacterium]